MKSFLLFLCSLVLLICGFLYASGELFGSTYRGANSIKQIVHSSLYDVEIQFRGQSVLDDETLRSFIPQSKSLVWWLWQQDEVAARIAQHALVLDAQLQDCTDGASTPRWRCFRFVIQERVPMLVAQVGSVKWIVDSSGVFLRTLRKDAVAKNSLEPHSLPFVRGIARDEQSPELVSVRLRYVAKSIKVIEKELGRKVTEVELLSNGEMKIQLERAPYSVTFDSSDLALKAIRLGAQRLKVLLSELQGREHLIESIDLAFHKLGVVKFAEGAEMGGGEV